MTRYPTRKEWDMPSEIRDWREDRKYMRSISRNIIQHFALNHYHLDKLLFTVHAPMFRGKCGHTYVACCGEVYYAEGLCWYRDE